MWLRRRRRRPVGWDAPDRVPDGDTVPMPGHGRWADLLTADPLRERTQVLPPVRPLRIPPWLR